MTGSPIFLDTSVMLLAVGTPRPARESCRQILRAVQARRVAAHLSVEAVQEFLHHRIRRGAADAVEQARAWRDLATVHAFDLEVLDEALRLVEDGQVRGRDAVHAATARVAGFDHVVSTDRDFDGIPGLRRIDPLDWTP